MDTISMGATMTAAEESTRCRRSLVRSKPISWAIGFAVVIAGGYAAYERIGTSANAELLEITPNLSGGFLVIGMTDDQPGFVLLSALDHDEVDLAAVQRSSTMGGTHTVVEISTAHDTRKVRLRAPKVLLVNENGGIESLAIDWSFQDFQKLKAAADCAREASLKKKRCGAPFTDLHEAMVGWPADRIPEHVRAFLRPFADRHK